DFPSAPAAFRIWRRKGCRPEDVLHNTCKTSRPILRLVKLQSLLLARAGLRLEIVNPADKGRKAHQNRFGPAPGFQSRNSSSIVQEIELNIAASAIELILTFTIGIRLNHAPLGDRHVGIEKRVADVADECKVPLTIPFEIIEKHTADTAHFTAMLQGEIL